MIGGLYPSKIAKFKGKHRVYIFVIFVVITNVAGHSNKTL